MNLTIFCINNDELIELEYFNKGYRNDIYVKIDELTFHLNFYNPTRLIQDFENEMDSYGYFQIEPNLILVNEVSINEIIKTIYYLIRIKYFNEIMDIKIDTDNLFILEENN